jgi:hypothetical protein
LQMCSRSHSNFQLPILAVWVGLAFGNLK